MRRARILCPIMLLLAACAPAPVAESPDFVPTDAVYFQLTGNDGAAMGQVGWGEVSEMGDLFCAMNVATRGGGVTAHTFRDTDPGLFPALRALVMQHGQPVASVDETSDRLYLGAADGTLIAIPPGPAIDGHASPLGHALLELLNAGGRPCLPFG